MYESKFSYEIPVEIGKLKETVNLSAVDADIPLLIGTDYQSKWGMVLDIKDRELFLKKTGETFDIKPTQSSHWKLPIKTIKPIHVEARNVVYKVDLANMTDQKLRRSIVKTH